MRDLFLTYASNHPTYAVDPTGLGSWNVGWNDYSSAISTGISSVVSPLAGSLFSAVSSAASSALNYVSDLGSSVSNYVNSFNASPAQSTSNFTYNTGTNDFPSFVDSSSVSDTYNMIYNIASGNYSTSNMFSTSNDLSWNTPSTSSLLYAPIAANNYFSSVYYSDSTKQTMNQISTIMGYNDQFNQVAQNLQYGISSANSQLQNGNVSDVRGLELRNNLGAFNTALAALNAYQSGQSASPTVVGLGLTAQQESIANYYIQQSGASGNVIASSELSTGQYFNAGLALTGVGAGVSMLSNAGTISQGIYGAGIALWSADQIPSIVTGQSTYTAQAVDALTGNHGIGDKVNAAIGLSFLVTTPSAPVVRSPYAVESGVLQNANYAQKTFSQTFSSQGTFAGRTVEDVAGALRSGAMKSVDVPVQYIFRNNQPLILNTRSAQALEQAGIPRTQWNAVNMTGNADAEARLTRQLFNNNLTSQGTPTVRPSGGR